MATRPLLPAANPPAQEGRAVCLPRRCMSTVKPGVQPPSARQTPCLARGIAGSVSLRRLLPAQSCSFLICLNCQSQVTLRHFFDTSVAYNNSLPPITHCFTSQEVVGAPRTQTRLKSVFVFCCLCQQIPQAGAGLLQPRLSPLQLPVEQNTSR